MINCLELCRHCWNPIKINLPFLASLSIRFLISHHFHVFPSSNIIQYEFKKWQLFPDLNMCSTNAADLAALESLEPMIRELLTEQLLAFVQHQCIISAQMQIIPIEAVWRTKSIKKYDGKSVASYRSYSTQQLLIAFIMVHFASPLSFLPKARHHLDAENW